MRFLSLGIALIFLVASAPAHAEKTACEKITYDFDQVLGNYLMSAAKNKNDGKKIIQFLKRHESDTTCFEEMTTHYAIISMNLVYTLLNIRATPTLKEKVMPFVHEEMIAEFAVELRNRHLLHPLTPTVRKEIGGVWNEPHRVLGAYDCKASSIWFDPYLLPINLGSVMFHEMDHYLRDKFTYGKSWAKSSEILNGSLRNALILDEVMANIMSAVIQLRFYKDNNRDLDFLRSRPKTKGINLFSLVDPPEAKQHQFELSGNDELSLFSKTGAVSAVWNHLFTNIENLWTDEEKKQAEFFIQLQSHPGAYTLALPGGYYDLSAYQNIPPGITRFGGLNEIYKGFEEDENLPEIKKIIELVGEHYFKNQNIESESLAITLKNWLKNDHQFESSLSPLKEALSIHPDFSVTSKDLIDTIGNESKSCTLITSALGKGSIEGYSVPLSPDAKRPTVEGGRPSVEGGRPTVEGGRPSQFIKACFWPDDRL